MAQVHGRDGYLPKDRADLYERAVNLLLAHWHNPKERETTDGVRTTEPGLVLQLGVRTEILRQALEEVAFQAHELQEQAVDAANAPPTLPGDDLREALNRELNDQNKNRHRHALHSGARRFVAGARQPHLRLPAPHLPGVPDRLPHHAAGRF